MLDMQYNKIFNNIVNKIDGPVKLCLEGIEKSKLVQMQEIRIRANMPLIISFGKEDFFVNQSGTLTKELGESYIVRNQEVERIFEMICSYSKYSFYEEIKKGFITIEGGHRIGLSGKVVLRKGEVVNITNISGINIRIAKENIGCSENIISKLLDFYGEIMNTLIISPPQAGKTTLLRDMARILSDGSENLKIRGYKVGIIDERSEIAAVYKGVPQNNVGLRTDILDSCPKTIGVEMLIRAMSPQVIIIDELGFYNEIEVLNYACNAGVKIIASIHGWGVEDIKRRPKTSKLISEHLFEKAVVINQKHIARVIDLI